MYIAAQQYFPNLQNYRYLTCNSYVIYDCISQVFTAFSMDRYCTSVHTWAFARAVTLPVYYNLGEAVSANCDDVEDGGQQPCTKNFKKANVQGWSFCFLFFCPKHGHCYGLHLISGSEGRKDPFAALLKYLPVAPKLIFYDFACSLSEYALNREPGYFQNTEFCHDVFHSVNHNCPYAFSSESTANKRNYNTSCCEQFNSYFVKIKSTGRCLKMSRFMLYAQYMIYLWNRDRTKSCLEAKEKIRKRVQPKAKE